MTAILETPTETRTILPLSEDTTRRGMCEVATGYFNPKGYILPASGDHAHVLLGAPWPCLLPEQECPEGRALALMWGIRTAMHKGAAAARRANH